jgi:hypothetical protein
MGNYYETEIKIKSSVADGFEKAVAVLDLLDWRCDTNGVDLVVARTPFSVFGFGEKLTISLKSKHRLHISSDSRYPFQLFDLGKNQSNVEKFIEIFQNGNIPLNDSDFAHEKKRSFLDRYFSAR